MITSFVVVQAEKDAKRKARAKELKKLRKAKEKKAQVRFCFILYDHLNDLFLKAFHLGL